MQEIHDEKRIESILRQESKHFQKRPQSVHLLQYEKGELLTAASYAVTAVSLDC